jgi:hypothetical protein
LEGKTQHRDDPEKEKSIQILHLIVFPSTSLPSVFMQLECPERFSLLCPSAVIPLAWETVSVKGDVKGSILSPGLDFSDEK